MAWNSNLTYNLGAKLIYLKKKKTKNIYGFLDIDASILICVLVCLKNVIFSTHLLLNWWEVSHTKRIRGHGS